MKKMFVTPVAAAAAGLALVGAMGGSSSAASRPDAAPLVASYAGNLDFTGPASAAFDGVGIGTLVGASTVHGEISILGPALSCEHGGFVLDHTDTITAANGSQAVLAVQDTACQTAPGSNVYTCDGAWTVSAATGKLGNASSSGRFSGEVDFNTKTFEATYVGIATS